MNSLQDYIATLTPEEQEKHKELIKECIDREKSIIEAGDIMREKLPRLFSMTEKMVKTLSKIHEKTNQLHSDARKLKDHHDAKILAELPDEKFFVA